MTRPLIPKTQTAPAAVLVDGKRTETTAATSPRSNANPNVSSGRESAESFVFVFLVFLVLGVEAEGFVIPTGSMAPTLMGRHKEVTCPDCGQIYAVNADREVSDNPPLRPSARYVEAGTCVNCRYQARIADDPNFQGDRIYVMKTPLDLPFLRWLGRGVLKRWDIAVFKLPEEPEVRYIKRLVGMPNEFLRILRGDIWTCAIDVEGPFDRALRPLAHQDAMQMLVYDDRHRPKSLADDPSWKRWVPVREGDVTEETAGSFRIGGGTAKAGWSELHYRHIVPDPIQWGAIVKKEPLPYLPRRTLITDFYSYNTDLTLDALSDLSMASKAWSQANWVGDLTLSFQLQIVEPKGKVRIDLIKAGMTNRAEIDLANGTATLFHHNEEIGKPVVTKLNKAGTYAVSLANVDDRLTLRIDGKSPFGNDGESYGYPGESVKPTVDDLEPARIGVSDGSVVVSELVLKRDIYYTLEPTHADFDSLELEHPLPRTCKELFDWLADPEKFASVQDLQPHDYRIREGHYMMLGDNSPWSRDGRAWSTEDQIDPRRPGKGWDDSGRASWEVPEALLIGKAFCVYWPHPVPFGPTFRIGRDNRLPIRPGFEKMRWIR